MAIQFVKTKDEAKKITFVKTTGAGAQQVSPPSAAVSQNVSFTKSGKTRDDYDAVVRSNYAAAQKTAAPILSKGTSFASKANSNLNRTTLQAPELDPMAIAAKNQAEKTAESHKMAAGAGRSGVITETQAGFSPLKLAGGAILKGTDTAMSGLTSTAGMLVGDAITEAGQLVGQDWSGNPITALNNRLQKAKATNQSYFQGNVDAGGKAAKIADELGTATVAAVPQALLAIATAGGGAATKGLEAVAKASGKSGILNTIGQATGTMLKDPQYWLSFLQVAGDGYDEAKADGASDREAYLFALSNGMMNAMVEVGGVTGEGGIQSLPEQLQQGGSAARKWIKTMVEEGKENVVQGIIERGLQNVVYQKGNALYANGYQKSEGQKYADEIGKYGLGNIDLLNRPKVNNSDGSYSTVDSFSNWDDSLNKEVLVPTVIQVDGKWEHVSEDEAWEHYLETGEYLGKFDNWNDADAYAEKLHEAQAYLYGGDQSQSAILNPKTAAGEFTSGAVVGGILGGGQLLDIIPKLSSTTRESPDTARNRSAGINLQSAAANIGLSESNVPQANVENTGSKTTEKNYDIIPKLAAVSENENTKQPVKRTLEEYLGERGLSSPISDYMLDKLKNPNGLTQRQLKKLQTDAAAAANEYATAREQAISEYNQQVATGKIVGKTRIERLLDTAQGREENESVQAARRALQKRGIAWNGNSPDTVSDRSTETPQSTVTGTELNLNITQPNGESNGNSSGSYDIIPKLADATEDISNKGETVKLLQKLKSSIPDLSRMDSVKQLEGNEFPREAGKFTKQVADFFARINNVVSRKGFGDVILDERGAKSDIGHGLGRAKAVTMAAVPEVIQNGKQIDYAENWKGRGKDSYVFAAPVDYGGKKTYVAAVVLKDSENRFYLHEVLDENGNQIFIKNDSGSEPIKTGMSAQSGDTGVQKPLSEFNISQPTEEIKGNPADFISDDSADYLDNLAKDENEMTTPVTAADLAKAAMRDRLDKMEAPPENRTEPIAQSDLDDLVKLYENVANPITDTEQRRSESMENARSLVSSDKKAGAETLSQKADNAKSYFMRKMVDSGDSVTRIGKAVKDQYLYPYYNMARASASAGVNMIQGEQTDVSGHKVGESLNDILSPIRQKGADYYKAFQLYMYHLHNIDRMSIVNDKNNTARLEAEVALRDFDRENPDIAQVTEERLRRKAEGTDDEAELAKERIRLLRNVNRADKLGNKPVFDYGITAKMSRDETAKLLREHPEFTEYQQQVRSYLHNLMQYRVDSGLMTQENTDFLEKYYPNYVPTYRNVEKAGGGSLLKSIRIGKTVGRAQGGTEKLLPLHTAIGQLTMKTVRESSKNRFGARLLDAWNSNPSDVRKYISDAEEYEAPFSPDTFDSQDDTAPQKSNTFSVYRDGKLWEMQVDPSLFEAVKTLSPDRTEESVLLKAVTAQNDLFKGLVTGYNPMFTVRNTVRDLQTAGLYSRDLSSFAKNYPLALKEIAENGEYWKQYKALGGVYSSVFDYQTGTIRESSDVVKKTLGRIEALNMTMEQAPRLAEFMSIVKSGDGSIDNLMDAMHAAADVTVNFGRSGTLGHVLNKTFVPFLNPGIQGFDRMVRRVTETKGGKEWAKLAIRAASLGVAPTLLNALLYKDDKDWDDLRESDKDTNYLIKIGDGVWLKIPKGRELSILGMSAQRVKDLIDGKQVNWGDFITTVGNQVAPSNPLKTNIISAFADSALFDKSSPGKTWYGGDIESQRLQNYAPGQRYDSSTDVFSKWIGGQLNLSPKKINYILDQYSGVVGDFVLPLLTPQAERDPFTKAFTVDSVSSNRISGDFYDKGDQITFAKNAGDTSMQAVSRFWNKQVQASSDIYSQIREIENSDLSDSEKKQKVREAQAVINGIQKNALATVDIYQQRVKKYLAGGGDVDTAYREANRECFGADYALQTYNKDVYGKAQQANSNGVSYDDYYQYYFDTKGFESKDGKSTSTQKLNYLESSSMGDSSKAEIYFADLASDSDLTKQEKLETDSGISRVQYWQFKAATAGMTIKADKMKAIESLNLTSAQKTALYYAEGYAESTLDEAPWMNQKTAAYDIMPKLTKSAVKRPVFTKTASSYDIIPKLTK